MQYNRNKEKLAIKNEISEQGKTVLDRKEKREDLRALP